MIDYNVLDKSKIYVSFSSGNTWISKIIKWTTRSKFSHSFILYWDKDYQKWMALGDNFNGWVFCAATTEHTLAVAECPIDLWRGLRYNILNLGSFYDYPALIGMVFVLAGKFLFKSKKQWPNIFNSKKKYICSEICTKVIQDSGLNLDLIPSSTDPQTLFESLEKVNGIIITTAY